MTNQFCYRHACFGLFQHRHNLLDTEALAFHRTGSFILEKSAENSLTSWHCLLGAAHLHGVRFFGPVDLPVQPIQSLGFPNAESAGVHLVFDHDD
nr:hypothetical protein [Burkholderia pseudomultivorans]